MLKLGTTQVLHIIMSEDGTSKELNYLKCGDDIYYVRTAILTFTQTNCTYKVKRISSDEPSVTSFGDLTSGDMVYYGDVLQVYSIAANFGYENPKVYYGGAEVAEGGTITVRGNTVITSSATAIVLCTVSTGTWESSVGGKTTYFGYGYGTSSGSSVSYSDSKSSGSYTIYLKDVPSSSSYTILKIFGRYDNSNYIVKEIDFGGRGNWNGTRDKSVSVNIKGDVGAYYDIESSIKTLSYNKTSSNSNTLTASESVSMSYCFYLGSTVNFDDGGYNRFYHYKEDGSDGGWPNPCPESSLPVGYSFSNFSRSASINGKNIVFSASGKFTYPGSWWNDYYGAYRKVKGVFNVNFSCPDARYFTKY